MASKFWVSMTDKFMSGWGKAEGKTNKLIIECNTYNQAITIKRNAEQRPEMTRINIYAGDKPYFPKSKVLISWKTWDDMGDIWKQ